MALSYSRYNYMYLSIVSVLLSFFYAKLTVIAQTYDSLVYFEHYLVIHSVGLLDFFRMQLESAGKVDPALYLFYFFLPSGLSLFWFVFANYILVSFALFVLYKLINRFHFRKQAAVGFFLFILIFFIWYPSYMSLLWIWRNYISVIFLACFFVLYLYGNKLASYLLLLISILFHSSSVLFLFFFIASLVYFHFAFKLSNRLKWVLVFFIGFFIGLVINSNTSYFDFIFSGGSTWSSTGSYTAGFVLIYLFLISLFFCFFCIRKSSLHKAHVVLIVLLFFLLGFSFPFFGNHLVLMRFLLLVFFVLSILVSLFFGVMRFERKVVLFFLFLPGILVVFHSVINYI